MISPPPWPPDLHERPYIRITTMSRVNLFRLNSDPIPIYLRIFGDFAAWASKHDVHIGIENDDQSHQHLWIVAYGSEEGLSLFSQKWHDYLRRMIYLFAYRATNFPLTIALPRAFRSQDVDGIFPNELVLDHRMSDDDYTQSVTRWHRMSERPFVHLRPTRSSETDIFLFQSEEDMVAARLCGFA